MPTKIKPKSRKKEVAIKTEIVATDLHKDLQERFYLTDLESSDRAIQAASKLLALDIAEAAFAVRGLLLEARLGFDTLGYNRELKEKFWQAEKIDLFSCHDVSRAKNPIDCELNAKEEAIEREQSLKIGKIFSDEVTKKEFCEKSKIDRQMSKRYCTPQAREKYATVFALMYLWKRSKRDLGYVTEAVFTEFAAEKMFNAMLEAVILGASFYYCQDYEGQKWFRYSLARLLDGAESFSASMLVISLWDYIKSANTGKNYQRLFALALIDYLGKPNLPKLIRHNQVEIMRDIVSSVADDELCLNTIYFGWKMLLQTAETLNPTDSRKQEILGMLLQIYLEKIEAFDEYNKSDFCQKLLKQLVDFNDEILKKDEARTLLNLFEKAAASFLAERAKTPTNYAKFAQVIQPAIDAAQDSKNKSLVLECLLRLQNKCDQEMVQVGALKLVEDASQKSTAAKNNSVRLTAAEKEEMIKNHPVGFDDELVQMLVATESMQAPEVRYWFTLADQMSEEQKDKLRAILKNEEEQLKKLDNKYIGEVEKLNDLELWIKGRKREELLSNLYYFLAPNDQNDGPNVFKHYPASIYSSKSPESSESVQDAPAEAQQSVELTASVQTRATDKSKQFKFIDHGQLTKALQNNLLEISSTKFTRNPLFATTALYENLDLGRKVVYLASTDLAFKEVFCRSDEETRKKISMISFSESIGKEVCVPAIQVIAGKTMSERIPSWELFFEVLAKSAGHQVSTETKRWLIYIDKLLEPVSAGRANGLNLFHSMLHACVPMNVLIAWQNAAVPECYRFPEKTPPPTKEVLDEIKKISCSLYCGCGADPSTSSHFPYGMLSSQEDFLDYSLSKNGVFVKLPDESFQRQIAISSILSRIYDFARKQNTQVSVYLEEGFDFIKRFSHENLYFRFDPTSKVFFEGRQDRFNNYQLTTKNKLVFNCKDDASFEVLTSSEEPTNKIGELTTDQEISMPEKINTGYLAEKFCLEINETKGYFEKIHSYLRLETAQAEFKKTRVRDSLMKKRNKTETGDSIAREEIEFPENQALRKLATSLQNQVIGQTEAIYTLARSVKSASVGLKINPRRPNGVFLFLGPTGTGKTELAKALARELFDSEDALIRLDMSEFQERHTVSKMIGSPTGYLGSDEGGYLTEAVRRQPHSVVLFDEVEKAHRDVYNLFLQIFDDGRLTDGRGNTTDFRNTYIIMTSNIGNNLKDKPFGFSTDDYENKKISHEEVVAELKKFFSPELIGRLDEVCFFDRLSDEELHQVADLKLKQASKNLAINGHVIEFEPSVTNFVLQKALQRGGREFATREFGKTINREIIDPLTECILQDGKQDISVSAVRGKVKLTKIKQELPAENAEIQSEEQNERSNTAAGTASISNA